MSVISIMSVMESSSRPGTGVPDIPELVPDRLVPDDALDPEHVLELVNVVGSTRFSKKHVAMSGPTAMRRTFSASIAFFWKSCRAFSVGDEVEDLASSIFLMWRESTVPHSF